jgi:hypothetical protein
MKSKGHLQRHGFIALKGTLLLNLMSNKAFPSRSHARVYNLGVFVIKNIASVKSIRVVINI